MTTLPDACVEGRSTTGMLCLILLTTQLLPPLPEYLSLVPSMALGTVMAAGVCILIVSARWAMSTSAANGGLLNLRAGGFLLIAVVVVVTLLHGVVAEQLSGVDFGRFFAALIPLVCTLGGALALASTLRCASAEQVAAASWVSFWVLCSIILFKVVGLQPRASTFPKSTFPFTETSHFALALGPIFLYRCATARPGRRDLWVAFGLALPLLLKSGTLLALGLLGAMVCRRFLPVLAATIVIAVVGFTVELKYFTSRVDLSNRSSNLSALVYLEGWEMLDGSLSRSDGWGVGFEQLGLNGTNVPAAESIRRVTGGEDFNLQDGSFVLSKLGSEFGALGLLMVLGFCALAWKSLRSLRSGVGRSGSETFARCVVLSYSVDMFVRGTGYFTQSTLLFLAATLVLAPAGGLLRIRRGAGAERAVVLR